MSQFPGTAVASLDILMWRNYFVYLSTQIALQNTRCPEKNIAECGVCDGMGVYFALTAARDNERECNCYLYDAWAGMKRDRLLDSELREVGNYSYLDIENTRKNLIEFSDSLHFNKGYIPELFNTADNPDTLALLMIDLNSAIPTMKTLEFFYDRIVPGGVILFDDYSWIGYENTKEYADQFLKDKKGTMLALPTGQSMFLKI